MKYTKPSGKIITDDYDDDDVDRKPKSVIRDDDDDDIDRGPEGVI